jgi:hypothetical protein
LTGPNIRSAVFVPSLTALQNHLLPSTVEQLDVK